MELLEGQTLKQSINRETSGKPLPIETAIDFGVQIAEAIHAAHSNGIVHRDIKPANIFVLKQRRIKVLDFGLAKLTRRQRSSGETEMTNGTEPGVVMGTVGYMSPEQVRGQAVDGRTDIFAFGAILYEMLAGRRAFERPTSSETLAAILNEEPPAISQLAPGTPPALARVIKRCLEKDPEQRFQSASDLAFALEALSESSGATMASVGQSRPSRRIWVWTAVAAGAGDSCTRRAGRCLVADAARGSSGGVGHTAHRRWRAEAGRGRDFHRWVTHLFQRGFTGELEDRTGRDSWRPHSSDRHLTPQSRAPWAGAGWFFNARRRRQIRGT